MLSYCLIDYCLRHTVAPEAPLDVLLHAPEGCLHPTVIAKVFTGLRASRGTHSSGSGGWESEGGLSWGFLSEDEHIVPPHLQESEHAMGRANVGDDNGGKQACSGLASLCRSPSRTES